MPTPAMSNTVLGTSTMASTLARMLVSLLPRHENSDASLCRNEITAELPGLDVPTLPPPCPN